jgi:hypothetical protein
MSETFCEVTASAELVFDITVAASLLIETETEIGPAFALEVEALPCAS